MFFLLVLIGHRDCMLKTTYCNCWLGPACSVLHVSLLFFKVRKHTNFPCVTNELGQVSWDFVSQWFVPHSVRKEVAWKKSCFKRGHYQMQFLHISPYWETEFPGDRTSCRTGKRFTSEPAIRETVSQPVCVICLFFFSWSEVCGINSI